MNNKGFAITTILYGTLILFLMLLLSMLGILSTYKDRLSMLIDSNNGARAIIDGYYGTKILCGDIDQDGVVSNNDVVVLQNWLDGNVELSEIVIRNADFDNDGDVDSDDVTKITLYISMPDLFPLSCLGR